MVKYLAILLLSLLIVFQVSPSAAQDANYWTNQYGNEARLLGGIVVGSSKDVSAVFYNPGRLSLIENPELLLAGNVARFTSITVKDALGAGLDIGSSKVGGAPSLFAGEINIDESNKRRLAYSFLTRQDFSINLEERADLTQLTDPPLDFFTTSVSLRESMTEYWAGMTWSSRLSEKVGVGATLFGLFRDQNLRGLSLSQAKVDSLGGIAVQRDAFDYLYIGALLKLGIGADLGDWRAGLSVTTPNLKIYGDGNYGRDDSVVGQDLNGNGEEASQILTGYEQDVDTNYHSPTSVAAGLGYTWKKTYLDFTVEWFDAVPEYKVLDPAPISSVDGSVTVDDDVIDERKSVTNFGIGVEQVFSESVRGYLSFRTDKNASVAAGSQRINVSTWDILHVAGGASFPIGASSFTVGASYAMGSADLETTLGQIPDEGEDPILDSSSPTPTVHFKRLTLVLGFNISF